MKPITSGTDGQSSAARQSCKTWCKPSAKRPRLPLGPSFTIITVIITTIIIVIVVIVNVIIIIIFTRPRPAFGRLGLGGSSGG